MDPKNVETEHAVAALAASIAKPHRKEPGFRAYGILALCIVLLGIGFVVTTLTVRRIADASTRANCESNAALRNSYVDLLYRLTTPRLLPPGSPPDLVDYTNKVNKIATDYRNTQLKSLTAVRCGLLATGDIKPLPLPPQPPPPPVVALPGPAGPLPLAPLTGAMGPMGPAGPSGPAGAAGKDGAAGKEGQPGKNGNSILNGPGPPTSETGTIGDFYIDAVAHTFYGPKTVAGWGEPTSLTGPMGGQGIPGEPGSPAPTPTPTPTPTPVTPTAAASFQPTPSPSPCLLNVSSTVVTIDGLVCP